MSSDRLLGISSAVAITIIAAAGCGSSHNNGLGPAGDDTSPFDDAGSSSGGPFGDDGGSSSGGFGDDGGGMAPSCANGGTGWVCAVNATCGSSPTTITGKVYDPAGNNPLYNVVVFIPNDPTSLPAITPGTKSCNTCDVPIGNYVVATQTDATGSFKLEGVPTGKNVPVVVQIGKWRRMVTVSTTDCKTTTVTKGQLRLPRNHKEGSMPQMALLTGGLDNLGCFLKKIGVDASEYTAPHGGGRLDIYQGLLAPGNISLGTGPGLSGGTAGDCTTASCPLWSGKPSLEAYDIVLLACEGGEANQTKPTAGKQAMHDWLNEGGKVFATHFHYTWFKNSPATDFQNVAAWKGTSVAGGAGQYAIDTSFTKCKTFSDWLASVGALQNGTIALNGVADSVSTVNAPTSRWVYDSATPNDVKYLSFGTPVGGVSGAMETTKYCGKAVFSDLHAGGAPLGDVPAACTDSTLTAQEEALEFLFFDLAACVQDDSKPPVMIPPPK
jgi:hypothetical protein